MVQPAQETLHVSGLEVTPSIDADGKSVLVLCAKTDGTRDDTKFDIDVYISDKEAELAKGIGPTGHEPGYSDGPKWCISVQPNNDSEVLFGRAIVRQGVDELARFDFVRVDLAKATPWQGPGSTFGMYIRTLLNLDTGGKPNYVAFTKRVGGSPQASTVRLEPPPGYQPAGKTGAIEIWAMQEAPVILLFRVEPGMPTAGLEVYEGTATKLKRTGVVCQLPDGTSWFAVLTTDLLNSRYYLIRPA